MADGTARRWSDALTLTDEETRGRNRLRRRALLCVLALLAGTLGAESGLRIVHAGGPVPPEKVGRILRNVDHELLFVPDRVAFCG